MRAKAAVPVNGEPIVRRQISWLVGEGLTDLVLNLHHRPASITATVGDGSDLGARVRYSWENPVLGSAGGPRRALPLLVDGLPPGEQRFAIVNGDTLTNVRMTEMIETHRSSGALVTMALIPNPRPDMYGGVLVQDGRVVGFTRRGESRENFHFIGVQVAEASVFTGLNDGERAETVMQLYPQLIDTDPNAIRAHVVDTSFRDIGTPDDYLQTSLELADVEGDRLVSAGNVEIGPSATLRRTAVWDNVQIGRGTQLEDCIVCDGVQLPEGSSYSRCAIVPYNDEILQDGETVEGDLLIRPF